MDTGQKATNDRLLEFRNAALECLWAMQTPEMLASDHAAFLIDETERQNCIERCAEMLDTLHEIMCRWNKACSDDLLTCIEVATADRERPISVLDQPFATAHRAACELPQAIWSVMVSEIVEAGLSLERYVDSGSYAIPEELDVDSFLSNVRERVTRLRLETYEGLEAEIRIEHAKAANLIAEQGDAAASDHAANERGLEPQADTTPDGDDAGRSPRAPSDDAWPDLPIEAKAMAYLLSHPESSVAEIAIAVGCNKGSLYRMARFKAAWNLSKQNGFRAVPRGYKIDGVVEAEESDVEE